MLYQNYQSEHLDYNKNAAIDEQLKKDINKNSNLINEISNQIDLNKNTLNEINKNIRNFSQLNDPNQLLVINESIQALNKNFNMLSIEIKNLKEIDLKITLIK